MRIGFLLFDGLTQLDLTGPLQVLHRLPGAQIHLIARSLDPVPSDCGLSLVPTATLDAVPPLDLVCVPGGYGVSAVMRDEETLSWLRTIAPACQYVTSVCTGAFILGAAGLLQGKRATTHWAYHDLLSRLGAIPVEERVVFNTPVITGAGVTAGIDFALEIIAAQAGAETAKAVQLAIEYDPAPPFEGGPSTADPDIRLRLEHDVFADRRAVMADASDAAAARL